MLNIKLIMGVYKIFITELLAFSLIGNKIKYKCIE